MKPCLILVATLLSSNAFAANTNFSCRSDAASRDPLIVEFAAEVLPNNVVQQPIKLSVLLQGDTLKKYGQFVTAPKEVTGSGGSTMGSGSYSNGAETAILGLQNVDGQLVGYLNYVSSLGRLTTLLLCTVK